MYAATILSCNMETDEEPSGSDLGFSGDDVGLCDNSSDSFPEDGADLSDNSCEDGDKHGESIQVRTPSRSPTPHTPPGSPPLTPSASRTRSSVSNSPDKKRLRMGWVQISNLLISFLDYIHNASRGAWTSTCYKQCDEPVFEFMFRHEGHEEILYFSSEFLMSFLNRFKFCNLEDQPSTTTSISINRTLGEEKVVHCNMRTVPQLFKLLVLQYFWTKCLNYIVQRTYSSGIEELYGLYVFHKALLCLNPLVKGCLLQDCHHPANLTINLNMFQHVLLEDVTSHTLLGYAPLHTALSATLVRSLFSIIDNSYRPPPYMFIEQRQPDATGEDTKCWQVYGGLPNNVVDGFSKCNLSLLDPGLVCTLIEKHNEAKGDAAEPEQTVFFTQGGFSEFRYMEKIVFERENDASGSTIRVHRTFINQWTERKKKSPIEMACYKAVIQFRKSKSECTNSSQFSILFSATIPGVRMISDMFELIETLFERHARACPDSAYIKYICGGAPFELFKNSRLDQCGIVSGVPIGYDGNTRLAMVNLKSFFRGEEIELPIFVYSSMYPLKTNAIIKVDFLTLFESGFVMMYPREESPEMRTERLLSNREHHFTLVNRHVTGAGQGPRYMELQMPKVGGVPVRLQVHGWISVRRNEVPFYGASVEAPFNFSIEVAPGDIQRYLYAVTGSKQIFGQFRMDGHETESMKVFREVMQDPLGSLKKDVGRHHKLAMFYEPLLVTNSHNVDHLGSDVPKDNYQQQRKRKVVVDVCLFRNENGRWFAKVCEIAPLLQRNINFRQVWERKNGCARVYVSQSLNSVKQGEMPLQLSKLMVHIPPAPPSSSRGQ